MNIVLIVVAVLGGIFALFYIAMWIKALSPSPTFEPAEYEPAQPDYWPEKGFRSSSPEKQGMDGQVLLRLPEAVNKAHAKNPDYAIDSISIYRNGYNVADFCFNPLYKKEELHVVHSVTKSIMAILVGIAVDKGLIDSVETPFVNFFPEKLDAITDARMRNVRIKDLLTMQTGIRSRDYALYRWQGLFAMQEHDDWVSFIMGLPLDGEPGTRFDYSNMSSYLLSAIIQEASGQATLAFARENLFTPLGIKDVRWEQCPQGYYIGYARMWLKPDDMAKIGLLYLQKGIWDGKQIVSQEWVHESITPHAYPKNLVDVLDANGEKDKKLTTIQWRAANFVRPFTDGYGYQWWLDKDGSFSAIGVSGQYIMVVPRRNLVVVVTNSSRGMGVFYPRRILNKYILPAIKSDANIAPNPAAVEILHGYAQAPALNEQSTSVPDFPHIAVEISGNKYRIESNRWNYDNFKLVFRQGSSQAIFSYTAKVDDKAEFVVGLDGVYRFSDTAIGRFAARGAWIAPDTFEIAYQQIGYSASAKFLLTFIEDRVLVEEVSLTGSEKFVGKKIK